MNPQTFTFPHLANSPARQPHSLSQSAREQAVRAAELRRAISASALACVLILVVWSAILAKTSTNARPLAAIRIESLAPSTSSATVREVPDRGWLEQAPTSSSVIGLRDVMSPLASDIAPSSLPSSLPPGTAALATDPSVRWFNGRPARPLRSIWMRVTAYSPDSRSCGTSDDGLTATMHSVETNGFRLAAADPTLLAYGSMVSIPGYDSGQIVPVLDCGGAIKGRRLDLLFQTHEEALKWGVKDLRVVVWAYADGLPPENPRHAR